MEFKTLNGYTVKDEKARNDLNHKLEHYVIDNTMTQQAIQNIFNIQKAKIIEFEDGNYSFNTTFRLNANTKLILNNAVLNFDNQHAFYNFLSDDEFLEYNGNGNIEVIGGIIIGGSFSLCHGKNIKFINVTFENCLNSHIIELMAINNATIKNCTFSGMTDENNFREYIQIDDSTYGNFPWFDDENNPTYDLTHCKNILVDGCLFKTSDNIDFVFHTAFGMHTHTEDGNYHENITLSNNTVINPSSHGFRLNSVKNVRILNNYFVTESTITPLILRFGYYAENVEINNNTVDGGYRFLYFSTNPLEYKSFKITNNVIKNMTSESNPTTTLMVLNNPVQFIIDNNFFLYNGRSGMAINGTEREDEEDLNSNNIATIIVSNNVFRDNIVNKNIIQVYFGDVVYLKNNTFDYSTETGGSAILVDNNTKVFISGNVFKNSLVNGNRTINVLTNTDVNDIYNHKISLYSGNTQSFTNQSVDNNSIFQFNTLDMVIGKGSMTYTVKLKPYTVKGKFTPRTYKIPIIDDNNDLAYITFTINDNGTISGSSSSTDYIRSIWGYNEIDI